MTLFSWMLVGHLVGDFLLQTRWMAEGKTVRLLPLAVHSLTYTTAVGLFSFFAGGVAFWGLVVIFLAHLLLDERRFVSFWVRKILGADNLPWLKIMVDQCWHILILALVTLL